VGLFTPLREHPAVPPVKRVENVLSLMVTADKLAREQREQMRILERSGEDFHRSKPFMDSLDRAEHSCKLLNAALMQYPLLTVTYSGPGRFTITDRAVKGRWTPWERWAVETLLKLAKQPGELFRLRRCLECQQWFYAIRRHKQFCGTPCYRHHVAQDSAFKEKRATYMREVYRPGEKERDMRVGRLSARGRREK